MGTKNSQEHFFRGSNQLILRCILIHTVQKANAVLTDMHLSFKTILSKPFSANYHSIVPWSDMSAILGSPNAKPNS